VQWASSSVIGFDLFWQFPSPALRRTLRNCIFTDYLGHELEKFFSRQLGRWYRRSEMLQCRLRHSYPVFMFSKAHPIIILKILPKYKASIFVLWRATCMAATDRHVLWYRSGPVNQYLSQLEGN
jgi:hypothetical protein